MAAVRGRPSGQPGSPFPGFPACVQLPPIRSETEWASSTSGSENHHEKTNTQPPESDTNTTSPYASVDSKKLHEAADRALDFYLNPAAHIMSSANEPEPMYLANPRYNTESLLANASETLGSASEMLINFAASLETSQRKTALGIAQVVMLGELAVNQALDHVELKDG
jgi:hypothetical protein